MLSDYEQKLDDLRDNCPVKAAIDVIRGRWKPSILWELDCDTKRFSDLQAALPKITAHVLDDLPRSSRSGIPLRAALNSR